jgi:hypothetical protein
MSKHVEPSPEQNEESHERLMLAFREYFKANQNWQSRGSRRAGENMRYWLAQIRIIAKERRGHVQQYRMWLDKDKAAKKENQKAQSEDPDNTN